VAPLSGIAQPARSLVIHARFDGLIPVRNSEQVSCERSATVGNMKPSTTDTAEGKLHEIKGTVKSHVAEVIGDTDLKAEGDAETVGGTVQKKIGQIEKVLGS
jgi:uncharacterized protein YjbJ (UPF0337 family)